MNKIIQISQLLDCDINRAFQLFTKKELLEGWLAEKANVELTLGGKYELFWNPSDPENDSTIGCRITGLKENEFLAFEWKSPKQFKHFANNADPLTHVIVIFIDKGLKTGIHLLHSGWRSDEQWEGARLWQERAWNFAFEALKKQVV